MMFATNAHWDRGRKPARSMLRFRKTWEKPGEPDIKAELVYSPLRAAWVYREPGTLVNQGYYHEDFEDISRFAKTQSFFPRISESQQEKIRKPKHLRGRSYAGALRRQLDESIERTSELEDKVLDMRRKLNRKLRSPAFAQPKKDSIQLPTFQQIPPKCIVRPVIDAQGKYYNFVY